MAAGLQTRGSEPGDRTAVYTQNHPAFLIGMLAVWKAGGVVVPVNPIYNV